VKTFADPNAANRPDGEVFDFSKKKTGIITQSSVEEGEDQVGPMIRQTLKG
jgi:hypothetical protein